MTGEQVTREMVELRRRLAELRRRVADGERSAVYADARALADEVICLIDEAPADRHAALNRLADRCEALLLSLAN